MSKNTEGQILVEIIIALALVTIFLGFASQLSFVSHQAAESATDRGTALRLAQEALEAMQAIERGNDSSSQGWNRLYRPPQGGGDPATSKGSANPYYPVISTSTPAVWTLFTGTESLTLNEKSYTREVIIDNVSRDSNGAIETTYNSTNDDPGTQKITITVSGGDIPAVSFVAFVTRFFNDSGPQSDWSGAANCATAQAATSSPTSFCSQTCISRGAGNFQLQTSC